MWSDEAIKKITSLQFPDFENMDWERPNSDKPNRGYFGGCLRHGTSTDSIESILKDGLDVFHNSISYRSNDFLWATNPLEYENGIEDITSSYGGNSVIFTVPKDIVVEQVNNTDFTIFGRIPVENIVSVDIPLYSFDDYEIYYISDIIFIVRDYFKGDYFTLKEKFRKNKSPLLTDEQYDSIFKWYERYMNEKENSMNNRLEEALIYRESRSLSYLKGLMDKDEDVRRILMTPISLLEDNELDLSYDYLVDEELKNFSLYKILNLMVKSGMDIHILYSDYNGTPNGIIIYRESSPSVVEEITVISFNLKKNNMVLIKDLMDVFKELIKSHKSVTWSCFKRNPAIRMYYKLCLKFGGTVEESPLSDEVLVFSVNNG